MAGGTDTREWTIKAGGISPWRMKELQAMCRQHGRLARGTPAQRARARLIEQAARETQGGQWYRALMDNACRGVRYEHLEVEALKSSNRNAYFAARREFFGRLDKLTGGAD